MQEESPAHRRLAENEVIARQHNRDIEKGFENIRELTKEEGHRSFLKKDNSSLYFRCECSNETCTERIVIPPSEYNALHEINNRFIVIPGHEVPDIEQVIEAHTAYNLVQKYFEPPKRPQS